MLNLIAAVDDAGGIGKDGGLPWKLSEDLRHFAKLTTAQAVIMGRATADSLPFWLPNRFNVVVSRRVQPWREWEDKAKGVKVLFVADLDEAIKATRNHAWVIGGSDIYTQTIAAADKLYITRVAGDYGCDRFFPAIPERFKEISREEHEGYAFTVLQ